MSILFRGICAITGYDWKTIKRDNFILVRECNFCGKIEKIRLV